MHPVLLDFGRFELGGVSVPLVLGGYGLMFALAAVGGWLLYRHLGRQLDPRIPWTDVYFVVLLSGFVGAKAANALVFLPDLVAGRAPLSGVFRGGGVWLGGVIAGFLAWYLMMRRHALPIGLTVNHIFVVVPFAHAIGRLGCLLGGCCYGSACDLPWAVTFTDPLANRLNGTPLDVPLHPTAAYEFLLEMANFAVVYALWRRKAPEWSVFATWIGLYGFERFLLEFLRGDPRGAYVGLSTSQWIGVGMVAVSALVLRRVLQRPVRPSSSAARAV